MGASALGECDLAGPVRSVALGEGKLERLVVNRDGEAWQGRGNGRQQGLCVRAR
jgi:hypothetical protein